MSELQDLLAEPDDNRSQVAIALDYLEEDDEAAMLAALQNPIFPSKQLHTAFATVGVLRDKDKVPTVDAIISFRSRKGWK